MSDITIRRYCDIVVSKDDDNPRRTLEMYYAPFYSRLTKDEKLVIETQQAYAAMKTFDSPTYTPFEHEERKKLDNHRQKMMEAERIYFATARGHRMIMQPFIQKRP